MAAGALGGDATWAWASPGSSADRLRTAATALPASARAGRTVGGLGFIQSNLLVPVSIRKHVGAGLSLAVSPARRRDLPARVGVAGGHDPSLGRGARPAIGRIAHPAAG